MSFQFECPNGHLLEGTPEQAGQQCHCPTCGILFLIPEPVEEPAPAGGWPAVTGGGPGGIAGLAPKGPELLHIPCPNGHELETPPEMLDQEVLCPQCNAQFKLRRKDSIEYKRQQEEAQMIKDAKTSKVFLQWAIIFAVLIGIGLVALIAIRAAS
jgi:rubredoxin